MRKSPRGLQAALTLTLALLSLAHHRAQAGEATSTGEVISPAPYRERVAWYEARRAKILEAANAKIMEDRKGGQYVVATKTQLGTSTYLVQETVENDETKTIIRLKYQRSISGSIRGQSMTVTLTPQDEKTRVQLALYVKDDHRLAFSPKVKAVVDASIKNTVTLLKSL